MKENWPGPNGNDLHLCHERVYLEAR